VTSGFGGSDLDIEESFEERGVAEFRFGGVVELAGQCFGGGRKPQVGQVAAESLIGRVVSHDAPSTSAA
jgi:hypothetical protein